MHAIELATLLFSLYCGVYIYIYIYIYISASNFVLYMSHVNTEVSTHIYKSLVV